MTAVQAGDMGTSRQQPWEETPRAVRVLIADDDDATRLLLRYRLAGAGMETRTASGGRQVLAILRTWEPDVVLLDWLMPGGGLDLVRELVAEHGFGGRVIMLSALDDPRDRRAAHTAGAAHYFTKPPDSEKLIRAMRELAVRSPR